MALELDKVHAKNFRGSPPFRFAQVKGTGDSDHASWWSFDDEQELRDRWWHPQKGETVLDVGAAFGSYALPALALGARVICFSPAAFDTELLELNLSFNPELKKRCLVVRDGLYSRQGWFNPDKGHFSSSSGEGQWLRCVKLDDFLAQRPGIERIRWMKIDVEGAELEVLKGAEQMLRCDRPSILVENHEFQIKGIENQVRDYLFGLDVGYACDGPYQHCAVSHSFFQVRQ